MIVTAFMCHGFFFLFCFLSAFYSRFKESHGPNLSLDSCGEKGGGGEISGEEEQEEGCDVVSGPGGNGSTTST